MFENVAPDLRRVFRQADDIARGAESELSTVHLLLAMFVTPCPARDALTEVGVDEARVIAAYRKMRGCAEHSGALEQVHRSAVRLSGASQADAIDSMLLLASLLKVRKALASQVLRLADVNIYELRAKVIGQVTLGVDRASSTRHRAARISRTEIEAAQLRQPQPVLSAGSPEVSGPKDSAKKAAPTPFSALPRAKPDRGGGQHRAATPPRAETALAIAEAVPAEAQPQQKIAEPSPPTKPAKPELARFELDPERYPTLCELGRNLTVRALAGDVSPLIGREDIVEQVIDVLSMRKANNPCLVGEAGVGKTAIVEGMAARIAGNTERYGKLGEAIIVELHMSSILAGTSYRGAFAERMKNLRAEVALARGRIIVFIDEVHTMIGAGAGDGTLDAANDLKTALARGDFPLIGATTRDEYRRHIEKDAALDRRFQVIDVPEPNPEEALKILSGIAPIYVEHHGLPYTHEAIASAVHLSHRFITDRQLPDKAISVLDRAGSQARRRGKRMVEADDIARAVQKVTKVPMGRLLADERNRIRDLTADLKKRIVGQDTAIERITRRVRRNYAGFSADKPLATFLFAGPPGVGKTETAKALAQALFLVDDALVVFDMNDMVDGASMSRLIGSPPGYVGHEKPGQLSEAMHKRPYRVLLFEHIDRAAPEIIGLLGQILSTGRIADSHGRNLDMRNAIIVLTTNAGADAILSGSAKRVIGFGTPPRPVAVTRDDENRLLQHVRALLGDDVCRLVDDMVLFRPLSDDAGRAVVRKAIDEHLVQLFDARLIEVVADESVVDYITSLGGFDPATGARALRGLVADKMVDFLTEQVLDGRLQTGSWERLSVRSGVFVLAAVEPEQEPSPAATQPPRQ